VSVHAETPKPRGKPRTADFNRDCFIDFFGDAFVGEFETLC
jgi:hypothetical protein